MKRIFGPRGLMAVALVVVSGALAWGYFRGGGEAWMAQQTAPRKDLVRASGAEAEAAETLFWDTLHGGKYAQIPETIRVLTEVYVANPNDPDLARRLAFLHAWWLLERNRMDVIPPDISNSAILSHKFYEDAWQIDPTDLRVMGAVADLRMLNGLIYKDERLMRDGYYLGRDANRAWPEFNYFTTAAALSILPHTDYRFREAVDSQWEIFDSCNTPRDLENNFTREEFAARNPGTTSVCWDNWIAPHNIKGTLLQMGDILVKSGDWQKGVEIYEKIRDIQDYQNWPLQDFLEARIRDAEANVENFRIDYTDRLGTHPDRPAMLLHSGYFCVACHQEKGSVPALPGSGLP